MTSPALQLTDVVKTYRRRERPSGMRAAWGALLHPRFQVVRALDGVSLEVRPGETVAYAGPNGAGKSTTIKLLAGILSPDSGRVEAHGLDPVRDRKRHVARIGVVFGQRGELWIDHPVESSFRWKKTVWRIPDDVYSRMFGMLTELLDLTEILPALGRQLSLGQRMRAELAMALLHEPDVLLLDEPTIGLDVLGKRQVLSFIRDLGATGRVTTVVTSHDMADLEFLADRIVLLHRGEIAFDGNFGRLRQEMSPLRLLVVQTTTESPPVLEGAELVRSDGNHHQYRFDPGTSRLGNLVDQAAAQTEVLDVETHRPDIDEVIADLYARWHEAPPTAGSATT